MWVWLKGLSGGAATFVGSLTGSAIGLIALLIGALFNARLNRQRDDRIRKVEAQSLAAALKAELVSIEEMLLSNAASLYEGGDHTEFWTPDPAEFIKIMSELVSKFGLLNVETIQATLRAYGLLEQYYQRLIMLGGQPREGRTDRRWALMQRSAAPIVSTLNRNTASAIREAVTLLDKQLA